jgi:shikimate dehydrogenase
MEGRIYGLLGRKLGHSYSVYVHKKLGNNDYKLYEIEPEELGDFIRNENVGGLNVTIPYKVEAMKYCDVISQEAEKIGAVNTVVRRGGKIYGYNADQFGFISMLVKGGIDLENKKVIILGSGGASKTALYCSELLGAKETVIISRSGENNYGNIEKHFDADIIINATPVGMFPENGKSPIDLTKFTKCVGVADMIYNPLRTQLLLEADALDIPCIGGLSMLTAQGKKSAELFFNTEYPDDATDSITREIVSETENIVLIGMPGSGKSVIGQKLAEISGREIIDTDAEVEKETNKKIPQIFAEYGEGKFREIESKIIASAGKLHGKIIVTGGGAVTVEKNYASLKQNGRIYEIIRDLSLLETRGRPLSENANLSEMLGKRRPLYEKFRDTAVNNGKTPLEAANEIWGDFIENSCD